jgi:hypothetical protein
MANRRRRRNRPQGANPPVVSPTPLQGLLIQDDSEQSPALKLLLSRMEQMEAAMRLELAEQRAATASTNEELTQMRKELAAEKERSRQALTATNKQAEKLYEARPEDPNVREAVYNQAIKDGQRHIQQKRMKIKKLIETAKQGDILNLTDQTITLGIHGFMLHVYPGRNTKIPQPFVDEWVKLETLKKETTKQNRLLHRTDHNFGDLESLRTQFTGGSVSTSVYDPETASFRRDNDNNPSGTS